MGQAHVAHPGYPNQPRPSLFGNPNNLFYGSHDHQFGSQQLDYGQMGGMLMGSAPAAPGQPPPPSDLTEGPGQPPHPHHQASQSQFPSQPSLQSKEFHPKRGGHSAHNVGSPDNREFAGNPKKGGNQDRYHNNH